MDEKNRRYLSQYIRINDDVERKIKKHAKRWNLNGEICAWYADWEDFCDDWCDGCGYTRTQARKLLHGGKGEFMKLPYGMGIVRFTI